MQFFAWLYVPPPPKKKKKILIAARTSNKDILQ